MTGAIWMQKNDLPIFCALMIAALRGSPAVRKQYGMTIAYMAIIRAKRTKRLAVDDR
jgi:hypothetical protein